MIKAVGNLFRSALTWGKENWEFIKDAILWAFLTFELILIGLFSKELRKSESYKFLQDVPEGEKIGWFGRIIWESSLTYTFIFILVLTVGFIAYRRYKHSKIDSQIQSDMSSGVSALQSNVDKMSGGLNTIEELNRTLPPEKFAYEIGKSFHVFYQKTHDLINAGDKTQGKVEETIREVLDKINGLAKTFDESNAHYATNLMLFKPKKEIEDQEACIKSCVKFWEHATLNNCEGILFLNKNLSTSDRDDGKAEPDSSIKSNIALPVIKTDTQNSESQKRVLPGAPRAYVRKQSVLIPSTDELIQQCKRRKTVDLLDEVIGQIEQHFIESEIKSFVSIPILSVEIVGKSGQEVCVGVVNIHKYEYEILRSDRAGGEEHLKDRASSQFHYLSTPYITLLLPLIRCLDMKCSATCKENCES